MRKELSRYRPILLFLLYLLFPTAFAMGGEPPMELLPEVFKDSPIGLSIEEFKRIRPNIVLFDLEMDGADKKDVDAEDRKSVAFFEQNIGDYDGGFYVFNDGKLALMSFEKELGANALKEQRPQFIEKALNKWGRKYSKRVVKKYGLESPVFMWESEDLLILISFTPRLDKTGKAFDETKKQIRSLQLIVGDHSGMKKIMDSTGVREATESDRPLFSE